MGKKKYIRPDIREESQILTVRAWVTKTQYVVTNPTTATSVSLQETAEAITQTSQSLLQQVTNSNYALQNNMTKTTYGFQNSLARRAS